MKSPLLVVASIYCAAMLFIAVMVPAGAAPVGGQGTWELTLQGRDLDGNNATYEAYYDTVLDITWLADAALLGVGTSTSWNGSKVAAATLDINGITGWRLPAVRSISGGFLFVSGQTTNATSDFGYAPTTTDGTDGSWRDSAGDSVSELGHMFYVNLGNLGYCPPDGGDGNPTSCDGGPQPGWGLTNTGPFSNIQPGSYWTDKEIPHSGQVGTLRMSHGSQLGKSTGSNNAYAWAVLDGDVSALVPLPGAIWFFGSGLMLLGIPFRKRQNVT